MKGIGLTLLLIALSFPAFSQCEYKRNEIDEFTGERVVETEFVRLSTDLSTLLKVKFLRVDSTYSLIMGLNIGDIYTIREGAKLMFILDNDSTFTATALSTSTAEGTYDKYSRITTWYGETYFYLNPEMLSVLAAHDILKVRIYTSDGYAEKNIAIKSRGKVRQIASCL